VKDRRKNLYCGPEHKMIPTLTALANYLTLIERYTVDSNGYNWPDMLKKIKTACSGAAAEVDKLILIDTKEVEDARKARIG